MNDWVVFAQGSGKKLSKLAGLEVIDDKFGCVSSGVKLVWMVKGQFRIVYFDLKISLDKTERAWDQFELVLSS
jgi:hypothetical protein